MSLTEQAYRKLRYHRIDGRSGEVDFFLMNYETLAKFREEWQGYDSAFNISLGKDVSKPRYLLFNKPVLVADWLPDGEILGLVKTA